MAPTKPRKLNQVIAVEKGEKNRAYGVMKEHYKTFQRVAEFNGLSRTYQPKNAEDSEVYPAEHTRVRHDAVKLFAQICDELSSVMEVIAWKDWSNTGARADVVVDGKVLIPQAPVTYLLYLEKELGNLKDEIKKLPELDPSVPWTRDLQQGLWRSPPTESAKTKKIPKVIQLAKATEHHPEQAQLTHEDVVVGNWTAVQFSGAIPASEKETLLKRVGQLLDAVKYAREAANDMPVLESPPVAKPILDFVLSGNLPK
jgi:hypothetical protein